MDIASALTDSYVSRIEKVAVKEPVASAGFVIDVPLSMYAATALQVVSYLLKLLFGNKTSLVTIQEATTRPVEGLSPFVSPSSPSNASTSLPEL